MTQPVSKIRSIVIRIENEDDDVLLVEVPHPESVELNLDPHPEFPDIAGPPLDDMFRLIPIRALQGKARLEWHPSRRPGEPQVRFTWNT